MVKSCTQPMALHEKEKCDKRHTAFTRLHSAVSSLNQPRGVGGEDRVVITTSSSANGCMFSPNLHAQVICRVECVSRRRERDQDCTISVEKVVTSTFGNGDPPENGEKFGAALMEMRHPTSTQKTETLSHRINFESTGPLANVRFSVFGLGSRAYPHFCAFAHAVDTLFEELGGERILRMGEGDELCGQEESFRTWAKKVFKAACDVFCVGDDVNIEKANDSLISNDRSWKKSKFRLTYTAEAPALTEALYSIHKKKVYGAKMLESQNLQSPKSNRSTIFVRLHTNNHDSLSYQPGDHLGIFPGNHEDLVTALIDKLEDAPPVNQIVKVEFLEERNTAL
ncbi:nitric oxide synthase, brain, partial [Lates japonicus]